MAAGNESAARRCQALLLARGKLVAQWARAPPRAGGGGGEEGEEAEKRTGEEDEGAVGLEDAWGPK
jgi:hypothetical protein